MNIHSLCPQVLTGDVGSPKQLRVHTSELSSESKCWAKALKMGSMHTYPLLWREAISPSSEAVCPINILAKMVQNNRQPVVHSQDVTNERPTKNYLLFR